MIEYYPQIKLVHLAAVLASGGLFALRGIARQLGGRWSMAAPARFLSYGVDIVLLSAALMLVAVLPAAVFANGWLWAKLALLVIYVGLGTLALKRGRTPRVRRLCFVAALLVYGAMFAVARSHHPLGPWIVLYGWLT